MWAYDLDIEPTDISSPATAQGFHRRFLRRKARGVALIFTEAAPLTVFLFSAGKHAITKAAPRLWPFQGGADTLDFGKIVANSNNHSLIRWLPFNRRSLPPTPRTINMPHSCDKLSHHTAAFAALTALYATRPTGTVC